MVSKLDESSGGAAFGFRRGSRQTDDGIEKVSRFGPQDAILDGLAEKYKGEFTPLGKQKAKEYFVSSPNSKEPGDEDDHQGFLIASWRALWARELAEFG